METSPAKRRKISQSGASLNINGLGYSILEAAASSAGTYRPSTFILETEELLSEVKVDHAKSLAGVEEFLYQVKDTIEKNVAPHEPIPIHSISLKFKKGGAIAVPFPDPSPAKDSQLKLPLERPSGINVVGSYASETLVKPQGPAGDGGDEFTADMVVEMPGSMFQDKDYLNLRYFYKRSYFLAALARAIGDGSSSSQPGGLAMKAEPMVEYLHGNPLVPVLVLQPDLKQGSTELRVRVIPCAPKALFPLNKLSPAKNCIRPAGREDKKGGKSETEGTESLPPTAFYNYTLQAESMYIAYRAVLRNAEKVSPSFRDACVLGRVWLRQRGFGGSISRGGFGYLEWSLLLALLMQSGGRKGATALSPSLSSHQMFKATLQALARSDLVKKPFLLGKSSDGATSSSVRETAGGAPVLLDASRQFNLAYKMSPWSAELLTRYAKWTLDLLNDNTAGDQFVPTFITKADVPLQMFDLAVRIPCPQSRSLVATPGSQGGPYEFAERVHQVLRRALDDRVQFIHVQLPRQRPWSLSERKPGVVGSEDAIVVGVVFDAIAMARKVDHGPSAEDKAEAKKFRQFWGDRAELRRFRDGSIEEALIWTSDTPAGLCEEIVGYILERHLRLDKGELEFFGQGFAPLVPLKATDAAGYAAAREAFATLERDIRDLQDLPLLIRQLAPTAPELRSASVRPPPPNGQKAAVSYVPMDVVLMFEASGKWPDNLAAIQRTKVAFLLKIGSLLEEAHPGSITARIGLEDARHDAQNLGFLDVAYEDTGAVFRVRIHSDLEESLLERQTKEKSLEQHVRAENASLLATFRRLYTFLPLQNQMVSTYCTRWPALSPAIRLAKRWFAAHKLASHFLPETIELFVLHAFTSPGAGAPSPWRTTPTSASVGLLRTLHLLAQWDWRSEPLVVDPSGGEDVGAAARESVATRLAAWRKTLDPAMNRTVLVVASPADSTGTAYTTVDGRALPSTVAALRMTALARSACRLTRECGVSLEPRRLFVPSLAEYDVLLRLDRAALKAVTRKSDGPRPRYKNMDGSTDRVPQAADPAQVLLGQLSAVYGGVLVFFHGGPDDAVIGALWNPMVQRRSFRANLPCSFKPVGVPATAASGKKAKSSASGGNSDEDEDDEVDLDSDEGDSDLVEVNREAILAEIARIGDGVIGSVEVMGKK